MASDLATVRINPFYWWYFFRARQARKKGNYRRRTLRYFYRAWQLSGRIDDLLSYALFRRDLGYSLPKCWFDRFEHESGQLSQDRRWLALMLLLEARNGCPRHLLPLLLPVPQAVRSPSVLFCLSALDAVCLTPMQAKWLAVHVQQNQWRERFRHALQRYVEQRGVCVVGNAGIMRGASLGNVIDQSDCVVRFNTFFSAETDVPDMGRRQDVWVITPGFQVKDIPADFSGHVVLTGPDPRYRLLNWSGVSAVIERDLPLLTIPLPVWRGLVQELAAPPSAGLLFLAWLHGLLGSWSGVSVAGFSALSHKSSNYHHTNAEHPPSTRHNWGGESVILQRWQKAGLTSLQG